MPGRSVDEYGAPLFVAWQLTNRCQSRCITCCEESGPDKAWADELRRDEALQVANAIGEAL
jgi:MoaA/NifB/PqqE/SkfB family radical SAM enzyme